MSDDALKQLSSYKKLEDHYTPEEEFLHQIYLTVNELLQERDELKNRVELLYQNIDFCRDRSRVLQSERDTLQKDLEVQMGQNEGKKEIIRDLEKRADKLELKNSLLEEEVLILKLEIDGNAAYYNLELLKENQSLKKCLEKLEPFLDAVNNQHFHSMQMLVGEREMRCFAEGYEGIQTTLKKVEEK